MKGRHRVKDDYGTEVFTPTGRNADEEAIICQGCTVMPDCNERHPDCALKKFRAQQKLHKKQQLTVV